MMNQGILDFRRKFQLFYKSKGKVKILIIKIFKRDYRIDTRKKVYMQNQYFWKADPKNTKSLSNTNAFGRQTPKNNSTLRKTNVFNSLFTWKANERLSSPVQIAVETESE